MKYIIAIDQGTTGSRAVAYDKNGKKVASFYKEFPQYFPKPGWVEHDPEEIWESVRFCLDKVAASVPKSSIEAIGITNQRETTVVWDRKTGKPAHNAIVWQCRRTAGRCEGLQSSKKVARTIRDKTGLPVDAYFSATKIEWILNNRKGLLRKAHSGELAFGTPDTWVLNRLTGGAVHTTDYTNASRTMLFNINDLEWDNELLRIFRVPRSLLPEVKPSSGFFGTTVKLGNLPAGIPVTGMAGDQQSALFGQACFDPGTIKNTYGTGAFMLLNAGKKRPVSRSGLIATLACGAKGVPEYCLEGSIFIAGAAMQWLRDGLKILRTAPDSEAMAVSVADNSGVYFVPAFVGLGAPYWDQNARGSIQGITRGTKREHIIRAGLEAMCYQTRDVLTAMRADSGLSVRGLKVDGGAAANNFLCQFQADILGVDVVRPKVIETTSLGAAYLAGLTVGYWKNTAQIERCWQKDREFNPRMAKKQADKLYRGWQDAVARTLTNAVRSS